MFRIWTLTSEQSKCVRSPEFGVNSSYKELVYCVCITICFLIFIILPGIQPVPWIIPLSNVVIFPMLFFENQTKPSRYKFDLDSLKNIYRHLTLYLRKFLDLNYIIYTVFETLFIDFYVFHIFFDCCHFSNYQSIRVWKWITSALHFKVTNDKPLM